MKIIYFTSACEKKDYAVFAKAWNTSLNTTIQNIHNRLIRSLALTHEVEVISIRPFSKSKCTLKYLPFEQKAEGKINWNYMQIKRNRLFRFSSAKRQALSLISKMNLNNTIILTDTLNPYILNTSTAAAKKYHLPIIGVCVNTPSGISNTGRDYTNYVLNGAKDLSGYIALTSGLNELYNQSNRAWMLLEGVIDDKYDNGNTSKYGDFIYYNGNLEEKYGIYDLIEAYKELNRDDIKLIISGYHNSNKEKFNNAIKDNKNIVYLEMLNSDEVLSFANSSLLNVNPRPYSEDYDRYLIPFGLIDYLGSKSVAVSVKNSKLQNAFKDDAIWVNSSDKEDLVEGINKALKLGKERDNLIKKANIDANKMFSMSSVNKKTMLFLKQFLK